MLQIKVGVHLPSLQVPFERALAMAAKLGADAVEIDAQRNLRPAELSQTALRELRKKLDDYRLRVSAISFLTRYGYDEPQELDARVAATKDAMRMARALGSSVVVNRVGAIPAKPEEPQWTLLVEVLTDLGRHGLHVGAMLAAQTGGASGADLGRLIAALPDGAIGVNLDPGQLLVHGHSPLETVEMIGSNIVHVHATDGVRDLSAGRSIPVPLGRGSADYPALLGALEERGYRGYFTVRSHSASNPEAEMGQAIQYLRNI
jgi:sugar phosphate isomerase/epimerase